jgi:hypothetical protein
MFFRIMPPNFALRIRTFAALILLMVIPAFAFAQAAEKKNYLGFDRNDYPGDEAMKLLRKNFSFTSYWLGNPPQTKSNSWSGKREFLRSLGYGFLPLFSGRENKELKNAHLAQELGTKDARAAASGAVREGFPKDALIFLDIEDGGRLSPAYHAYIQAWLVELTTLGFRGGFYCSGIPVAEEPGKSITTAQDITESLKQKSGPFTLWVFNDSCPPSPGCTTPAEIPTPSKSGVSYADVWQFVRSPRDKETARHCRGYAKDGNCYAAFDTAHKFNLDLNVATSADPSTAK